MSSWDFWVLTVLAVIFASLLVSYWKQISYSIICAVACVLVFILTVATDPGMIYPYELNFYIGFMPTDLVEPEYVYTVLTSMYAHDSFGHLFFNMLFLVFLGTMFEQRIGPRPFIVLYLLSGLIGTLAFAVSEYGNMVVGVGASGAISGVLGGFARLFPRERISVMMMFVPLPPMPVWVFVIGFAALQVLFMSGGNIAWQAHLGGLAGGILIVPFVVRAFGTKRTKRVVSAHTLKRLANTPELRDIYSRIEKEEMPDVRSAWISEFLAKTRCPHCGSKVKMRRDGLVCDKGHLL
ncbi:MAG TPA: rhomboid family intramembrane serine protease [Thermoplasmata archaeon]|jgi:membrane associated rhomboid family serine protease